MVRGNAAGWQEETQQGGEAKHGRVARGSAASGVCESEMSLEHMTSTVASIPACADVVFRSRLEVQILNRATDKV